MRGSCNPLAVCMNRSTARFVDAFDFGKFRNRGGREHAAPRRGTFVLRRRGIGHCFVHVGIDFLARHRDGGWHDAKTHRAKQHDPDQQEPGPASLHQRLFWGESGEVKCQDFTTAEDYQDHVEIKVGRLKRPCPCPSLCTWRSTRASEPWSKQLGRQRQICSTFAALG